MKKIRITADAEVIRNRLSEYTIKVYVPVLNQVSMDKFYFTGSTVAQALAKARAFSKENGLKLNICHN